jgi:predicted permease
LKIQAFKPGTAVAFTLGEVPVSSFIQDLRYSLRLLRKSPGFALVAILTIAIGIGASTTIFSWIHAVLLNPLPGAGDPARVVALETLTPDADWVPTSYPDFRDLRANSRLVESMSVAQPIALAVGNEKSVERTWGELVSGNFFELLRVKPTLGRFFSSAEVDQGQNAHPVAVISHALWTSHYHSDPAVIGAQVRINRYPYTIIGVAPEDFPGSMPGLSFAMWAPATMYGQLSSAGDDLLFDRKDRMFRVLARLAPGVSIEQARAEVRSIAGQLAHSHADTNEGMSATLLPMAMSHYGIQNSLRTPLSILMGACGVVLLIVCANVANLLLARATTRQKEFSIRLALGAPRSRLIRQLLTESVLLAAAGSLAGLLIASWLGDSLGWLVPRSSAPALARAPMDAGVLVFAAALAFLVAVLAGVAPALHAARENVNDVLKEGGRGGTSSAHSKHLRGLLVTSEMALAVVALIGAGLFVKSFHLARAIQPGFDTEQVALAQLSLSAANYDAKQADAFCRRLREQLERQPGVTAVSYADYVPLSVSAGSWEDLEIQGYVPRPGENMKLYRTLASPGYFNLLKIPILEGRDFDLGDDSAAPPVMIVNQAFVRHFLPHQIALGGKVHGWGRWFTIVGVVQDTKIYRLTENTAPYFYVPIRQIYRPEMGLKFYVRTSGPLDGAMTALRREAQAADPAVPVFDAISLNEYVAASLFGQKIAASLLSVLGGVALLLAAIGLYGVMGYSVAQRTNEIGIRVTLGAQPSDVMRLILWQGMGFALAGLATGSLAAAALGKVVSSALVSVSPADPAIYSAAAAFTVLIALVSTAIPAWRAVCVDPLISLRHE